MLQSLDWPSVLGGVASGLGALFVIWFRHLIMTGRQTLIDRKRQELLGQMLRNPKWEKRNIETLSAVIGANEEETARLLIELGARGSESGSGNWTLDPLPGQLKVS